MTNKPKIGLATILKRNGLILIGKRINSNGHNTWAFPGGHLEKYESFFECAKRELREETGLIEGIDVKYLLKNQILVTDDYFKSENKHYTTIFLEAEQIFNKSPKLLEPNKCNEWTYMSWEKIKEQKNLFLPIQNLIKLGYNPYK